MTSKDNEGENSKIEIGHRMKDGSVYAGISPENGKPMFTTPVDYPVLNSFGAWEGRRGYLESFNRAQSSKGGPQWRIPTRAELDTLFNHRAEIGGFNERGGGANSDQESPGWYWSCEEGPEDDFWAAQNGLKLNAWAQRFSDGEQRNTAKYYKSSVRWVRTEPMSLNP